MDPKSSHSRSFSGRISYIWFLFWQPTKSSMKHGLRTFREEFKSMHNFPYHCTLIFNIKSPSIDISHLHLRFHICASFLWRYYPTCNGNFLFSLFIYPNASIICQGIRNVIRLDAWIVHGALWYVEFLSPMWPQATQPWVTNNKN